MSKSSNSKSSQVSSYTISVDHLDFMSLYPNLPKKFKEFEESILGKSFTGEIMKIDPYNDPNLYYNDPDIDRGIPYCGEMSYPYCEEIEENEDKIIFCCFEGTENKPVNREEFYDMVKSSISNKDFSRKNLRWFQYYYILFSSFHENEENNFLNIDLEVNRIIFENCSGKIKINFVYEIHNYIDLEFRNCPISFIHEVLKNIDGNIPVIYCHIHQYKKLYFQDVLYIGAGCKFILEIDFNHKVRCPIFEKIGKNLFFNRIVDYENTLPKNIKILNIMKIDMCIYDHDIINNNSQDCISEVTDEIVNKLNRFDTDIEFEF